MSNLKCAFGVSWTSGIVAGVITWLLYTFLDPGHLAMALNVQMPVEDFRVQLYIGTFVLIWVLLNVSVFLNCYFNSLRNTPSNHDAAGN
jgi:hypothetical protein